MGPPVVLDAGAGEGKIARVLAPSLERIDAVDPSAEMIRVGRQLEGGRAPNIRWIESRIEDAPLAGPYGLATAAASFHWMDAEIVLRRLAELLAPGACFALIAGDTPVGTPWADEERSVMLETLRRAGDTTLRRWVSIEERLAAPAFEHACFEPLGLEVTPPAPFVQSVGDYLRCQHSRQSFSEEHLSPDVLAYFDNALREVLEPHAVGGRLAMEVPARIEWGRPRAA